MASQDTFCVLAFNHLQLAPNGTAKLCCIASEDISDRDGPLTLYRQTYEEIWNSGYMRSARMGMANGKKISACQRCYHEEETLGVSRRTTQNHIWLEEKGLSREALIAEAVLDEWQVKARPSFLQLNLGNLCNLACRMCSSLYSSRIAADPVHNKWMPDAHVEISRWVGNRLTIGPRPTFGVKAQGFYEYEVYPDKAIRWTSGMGMLEFTIDDGVQLSKLALTLSAIKPAQKLSIAINGDEVFSGTLNLAPVTLEFDLTRFSNYPSLTIVMASEIVINPADAKIFGVMLWDATLWRSPQSAHTGNGRAFTRFEAPGGWWTQISVLRDELLAEPDKIRRLIFQGGEPLIIPEVEYIFDYLIEQGVAGQVEIELTSNMTILTESMINKLAQFRTVDGGCSIDGIESDLEYIRYPAKWPEIQHNIERLAALPNVRVIFNVAVQFYNLMNITNLLRYCDAHAIRVDAHFLVGPYYLSVLTMPPNARIIAAQRLAHYSADSKSTNAEAAHFMLHFLKQHETEHYAHMLPTFMEFTNDMDVSRGQSFAASHPESTRLLAEAGYPWVATTRHAARVIS